MKTLWLLCLGLLITASGSAQLIKGAPKLPNLPGVDSLFKKGPAITTSLKDAKFEDASKDAFEPTTQPLSSLQRGPNGGFMLKAGAYTGMMQSYCLHAGTHGPSSGEGYLYAPPLGPYETQVIAVVQNSVSHSEIPQRQIQLLLWAMIARTKFTDLPRDLQAVASQLLTQKQILDLNGGALGFFTEEAMKQGLIKQPPLVQQVMQAENNLRQAFARPDATFSEMERIAVLTGAVPVGPGSRDVPRGRWSKHPEGFWVRYIPSGYTHTQLTVYVEEGSKAIGKEFNPATQIATPSNTARQRLIQSGRFYTD